MRELLERLAEPSEIAGAIRAAASPNPQRALSGAAKEYEQEAARQGRQSSHGVRIPVVSCVRALENVAATGADLVQLQSPMSAQAFYKFFTGNPLMNMGVNMFMRSFGAPMPVPFRGVTASWIDINQLGDRADAAVTTANVPITRQRTIAAVVPVARVFWEGDNELTMTVISLIRRALAVQTFRAMLNGAGGSEPVGVRGGVTVAGSPTTANMGSRLSDAVHDGDAGNQLAPRTLGYVLPRAGNLANQLSAVSAGNWGQKTIFMGAQACIMHGYGMIYGDWSASALVAYSPDIEIRVKPLTEQHIIRVFVDVDFIYDRDAFAASEDIS